MPEMQFIVRGQTMTAEQFEATAGRAPPKPRPSSAEQKHGGFVVTGWPPSYIAEAQERHEAAHRRWLGMDAKAQRDYGTSRPWDEQAWRAKNKPRMIAKLATPGGADALAGLARKQGWTEVIVLEVIRGKSA